MTSPPPETGYDAYDERGNLLGWAEPPAMAPPPTRRPLKKRWIVLPAVAALIAGLAVAGYFVISSILAGGANSPQAAGEKMVEALGKKDAVGLFGLLNPPEREAALRLQAGLLRNYQRLGLDEPTAGTADRSAPTAADGDDELNLAGIEVKLQGVTPEVIPLSADYALLRFRAGTVDVSLRPAETTGSIRRLLDQLDVHDPIERRVAISELSDTSDGVELIATKTNGRWYVSPSLSLLDLAVVQTTSDSENPRERGDLPTVVASGSSSPQDAAVVAVSAAVSAINGNDPAALASALVKDEAAALYLYGDASSADNGTETDLRLSQAAFSPGPREGSRQVVFVDRIQGTADSETFEITADCARSGSDATCINKSPYHYIPGFAIPNPWSMVSRDGKFALTAVQESNGWKISVSDSLVDGVINWADRVTPEQIRAILRRAQNDAATSLVEVETAAKITFNSGGYAVTRVQIATAGNYRVTTGEGSYLSTEFYSPDGSQRVESQYGSEGNYVALQPGEVKVLVWADSSFTGEGDSASVTVSRIIEPATFTDEYGSTQEDSVSDSVSSGSTESFTLKIPAGSRSRLQITLDSVYSYDSNAALIVTVDGRGTIVPLIDGTERVLQVTAGADEASIDVRLDASGYASADFTLDFG